MPSPRSDHLVPELREQRLELVAAAVDVADDVEGACEVLAVVPQRLTLDDHAFDILRLEDPDVAEALALQPVERALERLTLAREDVRAEGAVRSCPVPLLADALGDVEHDRDR